MGKKGKAGGGAGSSSSSAPPPPQDGCEVVFARGGGKKPRGHRQKGAGSVITDKGPREAAGGIVVQSWQRLPTQLLDQWAAKQKRPRPKYHSLSKREKADERAVASEELPSSSNTNKMRVILPDPKVKTKDLSFCPVEYSASQEEAKQNAALIALLDLQPTIPLETKLPEPYKTTWLQSLAAAKEAREKAKFKTKKNASAPSSSGKNATEEGGDNEGSLGDSLWGAAIKKEEAAKKAEEEARAPSGPKAMTLTAGQKFASQYERKQHEVKMQAKVAQRRREEQLRTMRLAAAYATVMMSSSVREEVGAALGLGTANMVCADEELSADNLSPMERKAADEIVSQGFTMQQALLASVQADDGEGEGERDMSVGQLVSAWLEWLCLHIPEDQLPARFDPRGRNLDVHFSGGEKGMQKESSAPIDELGSVLAASPLTAAQKHIVQYGCWDSKILSNAINSAPASGDDPPSALLMLPILSKLLGEGTDDKEVLKGREQSLVLTYEEEIQALEAIFEADLQRDDSALTSSGCTLLQVKLSEGATGGDGDGLPADSILDIWLLETRPAPLAYISSKKMFSENRSLIMEAQNVLKKCIAGLICEGEDVIPALFDIISYAKDSLLRDSKASCSLISSSLANGKCVSPENAQRRVASGNNGGSEGKIRTVRQAFQGRPQHCERGNFFGDRDHRSRGNRSSVDNTNGKLPPPPKMVSYRQGLPAANARSDFLRAVAANQVILVSGETGCGKSTQLPQFLLEEWEDGGKRGAFGAVVAQPRRIAAIGVASRVSEERGEVAGESVGYRVRGQSRVGERTKLIFCTTGVLLRRLLSDKSLREVTHLIIDEVHERHMDSDFLLALLRSSLLRERRDLKLILMSATLDIDRFQVYLQQACQGRPPPVLSIPGRTFPVRRLFLEDGLEELGLPALTADAKGAIKLGGPPLDLCADVVRACIERCIGGSGSILVFMPGTWEIARFCGTLASQEELMVLPLHGSLSPGDQARVFKPAPRGSRKIVVSTNVAEASITIPDVTVVIDGGRVKEMGYDPQRRMPQLVETWASKASMTQRAGRAGRVMAGTAIHLIHKNAAERLLDHAIPEMARAPLESLVLQVLALGLEPVKVLRNSLDPPEESAVEVALQDLISLNAVVEDGSGLTPLGWHLSNLPCPARVGKVLVYGAVLRCVSPILSIAAGLSCRSPFLKGDEATSARLRMSNMGGGRSDHTALAIAMLEWEAANSKGGRRASAAFCSENGLSSERMRELQDTRRQLSEALSSIGFLSKPRESDDLNAPVNENSDSWRVVKAAVCAGLYPSVARIKRPRERFVELEGKGVVAAEAEAREHAFFTEADDRVFIHPGSANFTCNDWSSPWLVFHERVETSKAFIVDSTEALPYALLLFGGKLTMEPAEGFIAVDDWIRFKAIARVAVLVGRLRDHLESLLLRKIEDPSLDIAASPEIQAMVRILKTNGMG